MRRVSGPPTPARFTRITLFLPVNNISEITAATRVRSRRLLRRYRGATTTLFQPPVLRGYYRSGATLYTDGIALDMVNVPRDLGQVAFLREIEQLRIAVCDTYRRSGSPQETIWLTASPIAGFVTPCLDPTGP